MDYLLMVWVGEYWTDEGPFKTIEEAEEEKKIWASMDWESTELSVIPNDGKAINGFQPREN